MVLHCYGVLSKKRKNSKSETGNIIMLISGISSVLCRKYRDYAEDTDFRELCRSALPHPVRCHDFLGVLNIIIILTLKLKPLNVFSSLIFL